jgi:hypothetical protein
MEIGVIGGFGMIGSNIVEQYSNDNEISIITRENFLDFEHKIFDLIFCAAADGRKYLANSEPYNDLINVMSLVQSVRLLKCRKFILVSTIDVYNSVGNVGDENSRIAIERFSYGSNRLSLEIALREVFGNKLTVIRLQGIIANNLKKNILFDIKNQKSFVQLGNESKMQYYPLKMFRNHIEEVLSKSLVLCNLSCQPISYFELQEIMEFQIPVSDTNVIYDVRSLFRPDGYWVKKNIVLENIENYLRI